MLTMKSIEDTRRDNLAVVVERRCNGNQTVASARLGYERPTLLNHWLAGRKRMSTPSARKVEEAFELPLNWMDQEHDSAAIDSVMRAKDGLVFVQSKTYAGATKTEISGIITEPPLDTRDAIGKNNTEPGPETKGRYPLVSWAQARAWDLIVDNFKPGDAEDWISSPVAVSESSYWLRVRGESMYDPLGRWSFKDGDLILVDPSVRAENESLVVVTVGDESEATFKQLIVEGDKRFLKALNPTWPERIFEIKGKVAFSGVVKAKTEVF